MCRLCNKPNCGAPPPPPPSSTPQAPPAPGPAWTLPPSGTSSPLILFNAIIQTREEIRGMRRSILSMLEETRRLDPVSAHAVRQRCQAYLRRIDEVERRNRESLDGCLTSCLELYFNAAVLACVVVYGPAWVQRYNPPPCQRRLE